MPTSLNPLWYYCCLFCSDKWKMLSYFSLHSKNMILCLEVFNKWNIILHGVRVTPQHGLATDFQKCELEMPVLEGTTEDEMAGWHHWLAGRESEWTPGVADGQGGLACCNSWGHKESDTTECLNWTELNSQEGRGYLSPYRNTNEGNAWIPQSRERLASPLNS